MALPRLLMFTRERTCPDQELTRLCLREFDVEPVEVNISRDRDAARMLMEQVGALAVPTFIVADEYGEPISPPLPVTAGQSVRGVDRGSIISEPSREGLHAFLVKHNFLSD